MCITRTETYNDKILICTSKQKKSLFFSPPVQRSDINRLNILFCALDGTKRVFSLQRDENVTPFPPCD